MTNPATALTSLALLMGALFLPFSAPAQAAETPAHDVVRFGMDAASITAQTNAGQAPDYGTFWVGPWTLTSGWGGPDAQLQSMKDKGVTPAVHFYYWGDDISPSCVENGCWSSLHNAQKDRAGWQKLADQLAAHLNTKMQGEPVVIFLETEFNKGGIETYEPFDGYLAAKADFFHEKYPAAHVVMSLGNWNSAAWGTYDRTAAASDAVGIQGMRGSTRDSATSYGGVYEATLAGAQKLDTLFSKPVFLQDIALSSYPEPDYLARQDAALAEFFVGMPALKAAGVEALLYRSWYDSPNMDLANYYGQAERHWGLAYSASAGTKAAAATWLDGVAAERASIPANAVPVPSFTATASGLAASLDASASTDPDGDALTFAWTFGDGSSATGTTATHTYAAAGSYQVGLTVSDGQATASKTASIAVVKPNTAPVAAFASQVTFMSAAFDAAASQDADGDALTFTWDFGDGATGSGRTASHTYLTPGTYTVRLTASDGKASGTSTQQVQPVRANAAPTASFTISNTGLTASVDGSGSRDADGDALTYAWSFGDGTTGSGRTASHAYSAAGTYTVKVTVSDGQVTATQTRTVTVTAPPAPAFAASFSPKGNEWWIEAAVVANEPIAKVEAKVGTANYVTLPTTSWGAYAKSINAPKGTMVSFRATSSDGDVVTSTAAPWMGPVFTATITPKQTTNQGWVEVDVKASETLSKVEVRKNSGAWTTLELKSWGSWAKATSVPVGTKVQFRATATSGASVTSSTYTWT